MKKSVQSKSKKFKCKAGRKHGGEYLYLFTGEYNQAGG